MRDGQGPRIRALKLTLPVMCGYLFLGTAFGATLAQAAVVVGLHLLKRHTLLSIAGGTAVYMLLLRM